MPEPTTQAAPSGSNPAARSLWFNKLSLLGALLAVGGLAAGLLVLVAELFIPRAPAYLGLLYVPCIVALVGGSVLVPLGYLLARRWRARFPGLHVPAVLHIDFENHRHRYVVAGLGIGGILAALVFMAGSFQAYRAMESNAFCGQTCHSVMSPEATAHTTGSHAQVNCVQCHIGQGVGHYVEAKVNGMRQLTALLTGSVKRPIPSPVEAVRAGEVCAECHSATRFAGLREKVFHYYISGEKSEERKLRMLLKIGGGDSLFAKGAGIHFHMQVARKVEYIARDPKRQEISWVRVTKADGSTVEYSHQDFPLDEAQKKAAQVRTMDCLDCHNRPAHAFKAPVDAIDQALAAGRLSRKLPHIKVQATKALDGKYESTAEAMQGIAAKLTTFYKEDHPDVLAKQGDLLKAAVANIQAIYKQTIFPEMKAQWSAYPENLSHRDWPGCFRCHAPGMVSAQGKAITSDCNTCHLILAQDGQVDRGAVVNFAKGKAFDHPGYGDTISEYSKCIDCHTGGADLY